MPEHPNGSPRPTGHLKTKIKNAYVANLQRVTPAEARKPAWHHKLWATCLAFLALFGLGSGLGAATLEIGPLHSDKTEITERGPLQFRGDAGNDTFQDRIHNASQVDAILADLEQTQPDPGNFERIRSFLKEFYKEILQLLQDPKALAELTGKKVMEEGAELGFVLLVTDRFKKKAEETRDQQIIAIGEKLDRVKEYLTRRAHVSVSDIADNCGFTRQEARALLRLGPYTEYQGWWMPADPAFLGLPQLELNPRRFGGRSRSFLSSLSGHRYLRPGAKTLPRKPRSPC